jgi:hypothetical protein
MNRTVLSVSLLLLCLYGCHSDQSAAPEGSPAAETNSAAPSQTADSAPVGTISSRGEMVAEGSSAQGEGAIDFDVPAGWQSQPPSSNMRVAQAVIPGPGGSGEFAVFYFGPGGGGPVEANLERWAGQMESADQPQPEIFETNGYKVTWIDVGGTLKASTMGPGPSTAQANARLFGAVVEGPGGPWFFKATGPEATMEAARDAFVAMLKSVRAK